MTVPGFELKNVKKNVNLQNCNFFQPFICVEIIKYEG